MSKRVIQAVPNAIHYTDNNESADYISGWNDCRQAMLEQPAPVVNVQHKPTTYTERFTHAVAVLCGAQPPAEMVAEWLEDVTVNGGHRLQSWVGVQHATPFWAQCIVVLDAAHVLANEPEEGEGHEDGPQAQPAPEIAIADAYRAGVDSGIAAEREACAKVVDAIEARCIAKDVDDPPLAHVAAAIRARGNT